MKVIDRVFVEILGWPHDEFHLEDAAGKGFIDYKFTIGQLARLIVEAKKDARDLESRKAILGVFSSLTAPSFNLSTPVKEFCKQFAIVAIRTPNLPA